MTMAPTSVNPDSPLRGSKLKFGFMRFFWFMSDTTRFDQNLANEGIGPSPA
jgi:hypothetical protein